MGSSFQLYGIVLLLMARYGSGWLRRSEVSQEWLDSISELKPLARSTLAHTMQSDHLLGHLHYFYHTVSLCAVSML